MILVLSSSFYNECIFETILNIIETKPNQKKNSHREKKGFLSSTTEYKSWLLF